jgi:hypothetical protein
MALGDGVGLTRFKAAQGRLDRNMPPPPARPYRSIGRRACAGRRPFPQDPVSRIPEWRASRAKAGANRYQGSR